MQLQSLQNPFSFYSNPALWPKLHPVQEKMIQSLQSLNDHGSNSNPVIMQGQKDDQFYKPTSAGDLLQQDGANIKTPKVDLLENPLNNSISVPFIASGNNIPMHSSSLAARSDGAEQTNMGLQQVCALQTELDDILNNRTMGYLQEDQMAEFNCFREMNGSKDSSMIWWSNDSDAKSASTSSWDSSTTPVLLPEGMFQDFELGYSL